MLRWFLSINLAFAALGADHVPVGWRLLDERTCSIETAAPVSDRGSWDLRLGRYVAGIREIRVETTTRDTALMTWTAPGPYDSRPVTAVNPGIVRIRVDLPEQKRGPVLKSIGRGSAMLACGKVRLTIRTIQ